MEDRLQKFVRLVEMQSYTKAAQELHISQPALTMAINKLEHELGIDLLIRQNRQLSLTPAGEAAYKAALDHQNITDQLINSIQLITRKRPAVKIGMTDSVAAVLCNVAALDELEAVADVTIVANNSRYLRESVEQRRLDVAFVIDDGVERTSLQQTFAATETLQVVCHAKVLKAAQHELGQGKLHNFVCYDQPSATYRHIITSLKSQGIQPHITLYSTSPEVMLRMVMRGRGVAALPHNITSLQMKEQLVPIMIRGQELKVTRPIVTVQLQNKVLPRQLVMFQKNAIEALRLLGE